MTDVVMPQMGESIVEGTLTRWLKKPGERVERDEPLFEISTDKVDTEIPSPVAGVLERNTGAGRHNRRDQRRGCVESASPMALVLAAPRRAGSCTRQPAKQETPARRRNRLVRIARPAARLAPPPPACPASRLGRPLPD